MCIRDRYKHQPVVDIAFNPVNTFRHLLTQDAAIRHLESISSSLRDGGLYIIGLHLLPMDADEVDSEEWDAVDGDLSVHVHLNVESFDRRTRLETLRFTLDVQDGSKKLQLTSDYQMRIYQAWQLQDLLASVPQFEHIATFDFWYDIEDPLELNDELGDTVIVLRKR